MKAWLLLLVLGTAIGSSWLFAHSIVPTIHYQKKFTIKGDKRSFVRHVLIPTEREGDASLEATYLLHALAGAISDDASARGYLKGYSRTAYFKELEDYKSGKWPCTYITLDGDWRPLLHLAFAQRWDDSPLPWEDRFLGDDDGLLPEKIETKVELEMGGFRFPRFQEFPELNEEPNLSLLRVLALLRPEIARERTEMKFLMGDEPSLVFLRELFDATAEYGIHRHSYRRPSPAGWEKYEAALIQFRHREELVRMLASPLSADRSERIKEFLAQHFFDQEFQPYIKNSSVYGHISGIPTGPRDMTARLLWFETNLRLPPSLYSFLEGAPPGQKPGQKLVRTDIKAVSTEYFEQIVLTSLKDIPSLKERPAEYSSEPPLGNFPCRVWVSLMERVLSDFVTRE